MGPILLSYAEPSYWKFSFLKCVNVKGSFDVVMVNTTQLTI